MDLYANPSVTSANFLDLDLVLDDDWVFIDNDGFAMPGIRQTPATSVSLKSELPETIILDENFTATDLKNTTTFIQDHIHNSEGDQNSTTCFEDPTFGKLVPSLEIKAIAKTIVTSKAVDDDPKDFNVSFINKFFRIFKWLLNFKRIRRQISEWMSSNLQNIQSYGINIFKYSSAVTLTLVFLLATILIQKQ